MAIDLDWTNNYPTAKNTTTEMPTLSNITHNARVSSVNKLRDFLFGLQDKVGSNLLEAGSLWKFMQDMITNGFRQLSDTPGDYSGHGGKNVRVNGSEDGLEFVAPGAPALHGSTHENGQTDEISVAGLSGLLADDQNPVNHAADHKSAGGDAIKLDEFATPDDNTNLDATTTEHGLCPKLDNDANHYLNGQGAWTTPAGGGSSPLTTKGDLYGYDTGDQRIAVGSDTNILVAASGEATGVKWVPGQWQYLPNSLPSGAPGSIECLYQFDKTASELNDRSGNGHNLTVLAGTRYYDAPESLIGISSRRSVRLQGPDTEDLRIVGAITVELLCTVHNDCPDDDYLLAMAAAGESLQTNYLYSVRVKQSRWSYFVEQGSGSNIEHDSLAHARNQGLTLVTLTRDGSGNVKFYINGQLLDSASLSVPQKDATGNQQRLYIFSQESNVDYYGTVCSVRITSGQFADADVLEAYETARGLR